MYNIYIPTYISTWDKRSGFLLGYWDSVASTPLRFKVHKSYLAGVFGGNLGVKVHQLPGSFLELVCPCIMILF